MFDQVMSGYFKLVQAKLRYVRFAQDRSG